MQARMLMGFAVSVAFCAPAVAQPAQTVVYGDATDDQTALARVVEEGGFGFEAVLASLPATIRRSVVAAHPSEDRLALVTEDADGALRVRFREDGAWGVDALVAGDVTGGAERGFDAAFEQASGHLVIAYRRAGLSRVYTRAHNGGLSGESSVDLGLFETAERIELAPLPGNDLMGLVASDGLSLRAAVWDGEAFDEVATLDGMYDNGPFAWDASRDASGGWVVAWARSGETTLRVRRFDGDSWEAESIGPAMSAGIDGVRLAGAQGGAAALVSAGGEIGAAMLDSDGWGAMQTLASGLGGAPVMDIAGEGDGAGVVAAWADGDRVSMRRWDGEAWAAQQQTAALGSGLAGVTLAPRDDAEGSVLLARAESKIVVYTEGGAADTGTATVLGLVGEDLSGVDLPGSPGASHGSSDLSYGNNADAAIAPGSYRDLSVGNNATLRFSAGTYVFRSFDSKKNGTRLVCDASGGDVEIILTTGDLEARNDLEIERISDGAVVIHLQSGDFIAKNSASIETAVFAHAGSIELGMNAAVTGHLFASGDVTVGSGVIGAPSWQAPGVPEESGHEAWAALVEAGIPAAPVSLTAQAWMGAWPLPLTVSERVGAGAVRIVRWRETPAFENE